MSAACFKRGRGGGRGRGRTGEMTVCRSIVKLV